METEVLISGLYGVNVPKRFAEDYGDYIKDPEIKAIFLEGPLNPQYWDAWDEFLESYMDETGCWLRQNDEGDLLCSTIWDEE
ncbi:MAG: hypothetical protein LBS60_09080 [Deltaproteobacteria bacterium]|nr:hypothetical protein [Deltaproteobacteria bacterium]